MEKTTQLDRDLDTLRDAGIRAEIDWGRVYAALRTMNAGTHLGGAASFPDAARAHEAGFPVIRVASEAEGFKAVRIGVSPAGVEWVAYKPENVSPMRRRLATLWRRHEQKKKERAQGYRALRR